MSNAPNNQPPNPDNDDALLKLLTEVKGLAKSDGVVNWLSRHIVLGNLILTVLTTYGLVNVADLLLPESVDPDLISKEEECARRSDNSNAEASVISTDSLGLQDDTTQDLSFGCRYIDEEGIASPDDDKFMRLQPVSKESLENIEYLEAAITPENLSTICADEKYYSKELLERFPLEVYDIEFEKAEYRKDNKEVYPVFRWACEYLVGEKANTDTDSQSLANGNVAPPGRFSFSTGINLDTYCQETQKTRGLGKSTYKDFNDPNSWYCTDTKANFEG